MSDSKKESSKRKKQSTARLPLTFLVNSLQVLLILALVGLSIVSLGAKLPFFKKLGINFFAVTSGSMEPTLPVGSLIYSKPVNVNDLQEGDIITYNLINPQTNQTSIVTHRITKVINEETLKTYTDPETGEEREQTLKRHEFVTKGDANNTEDSYTIPSGNVIGRYAWQIPYLGNVTGFVQRPQGFLLFVLIPAGILIAWEAFSLIVHIKNYYKDKSQQEIETLKKKLTEANNAHAN